MSLTVESLAKLMSWELSYENHGFSDWQATFLVGILNHVEANKALSSKQASMILELAKDNISLLTKSVYIHEEDVLAAIKSPTYDNPPYESVVVKREFRYMGDGVVAFRAKFGHDIAKLQSRLQLTGILKNDYEYFALSQLMIVRVTPHNHRTIFGLIAKHCFDFDAESIEYLASYHRAMKKPWVVKLPRDSNVIVAEVGSDELAMFALSLVS